MAKLQVNSADIEVVTFELRPSGQNVTNKYISFLQTCD